MTVILQWSVAEILHGVSDINSAWVCDRTLQSPVTLVLHGYVTAILYGYVTAQWGALLYPARASGIRSAWVCDHKNCNAAGRSSVQEGGIDGMTCPLGGLRGFAE